MRPEKSSARCRHAVFVLGPAWKRDALQRVGGLTLLGRALLALDDYGVERFAVVGPEPAAGDPALLAAALRGRRLRAEVLYIGDSENVSTGIADAWRVDPASLVIVVSEPGLIGEHPDTDARISTLAEVNGASGPVVPADNRTRMERQLFRDIRKPREIDGAIAFFVLRPVSTRITRLIWNTPVTPNQISLLALAAGVASGPVVALGTHAASVAAALLLMLNVLLDCVDGELARLTHRKSRLGEWLDTIGDDASLLSYLIGLGITVPGLPLGLNPRTTAFAAAVLFTATSVHVYSVLVREVGTVDTALFPHAVGGRSLLAYAMKRDFFTVLFLALAVLRLDWASLLLISLGAMVNAAGVFGTALVRSRS